YFFVQMAYSKRGRAWGMTQLVVGVGAAEEFTTCLGDDDSPPFCTCAAFRSAGVCDHLDAMRKLLEAGKVAWCRSSLNQVDRHVDVAAGGPGVRAQLVGGVHQRLSDLVVQTAS